MIGSARFNLIRRWMTLIDTREWGVSSWRTCAVMLMLLVAPGAMSKEAAVTVQGVETATYTACNENAPTFSVSASTFARLAASPRSSRYTTCGVNIRLSGPISEALVAETIQAIDAAMSAKSLLSQLHLRSEGGDAWAAMSLAEHIRSKGYENLFVSVLANDYCYSACVFILAGAYKRLVWGEVGIHRPYLEPERVRKLGYSGLQQAYHHIYERFTVFLKGVNLNERLAADMWQVPSDDLRILTADELTTYGLDRDDAITMEIRNAELRSACGNDAPLLFRDYEANVLAPCAIVEGLSGIDLWACINRRGSRHPHCRCMARSNPSMVCE